MAIIGRKKGLVIAVDRRSRRPPIAPSPQGWLSQNAATLPLPSSCALLDWAERPTVPAAGRPPRAATVIAGVAHKRTEHADGKEDTWMAGGAGSVEAERRLHLLRRAHCPGGRRYDAHVADAGASRAPAARARSCACQWPRMQGECVTCSHIPGVLRQRSSLSRTYPQPAARDLSTFTAMAFKGWPAEALEFYEGLEADNSKVYWTEHKDGLRAGRARPDGGPAGRPGGRVRRGPDLPPLPRRPLQRRQVALQDHHRRGHRRPATSSCPQTA